MIHKETRAIAEQRGQEIARLIANLKEYKMALECAVAAVDLVQRTIRHEGTGDLNSDQLLSALNSAMMKACVVLDADNP